MAPEDEAFADGDEDPTEHEADDEQPFHSWLPHPDDRLWRHPSEVGATTGRVREEAGVGAASGGGHRWAIALSAGVAGALIAAGVVVVVDHMHNNAGTAVTVATRSGPPIKTANSVMSLAEQVSPALVAIEVSGPGGDRRGSGVVYRSDGVIVTTAGLIQGASALSVVLNSGQEVGATVVGTDEDADIAVLRIEANGMSPATLAPPVDLHVGQLAVAVTLGDRPDGSGPTVYLGTVNGINQQLASEPPLLDAIETDAPVGAHPDGGVLLDQAGRIVGMTVASTRGSFGVHCYATPADQVMSSVTQIIATGSAEHNWIGIEGSDLSAQNRSPDGLDHGVEVLKVEGSSPASASGLHQGDNIVSVNGLPVSSMLQLRGTINLMPLGSTVTFGVDRSGQPGMVHTTLASGAG